MRLNKADSMLIKIEKTLNASQNAEIQVISPKYLPDLVNIVVDLLLVALSCIERERKTG